MGREIWRCWTHENWCRLEARNDNASRHSLNQIPNKERRLGACLFAETAGNPFDFGEPQRVLECLQAAGTGGDF
ncbi:hypothetical protein LEMLEM_LOCUS11979, partial [Lemmus lemmus]